LPPNASCTATVLALKLLKIPCDIQ
jgi:hypothetical protein